MPSKIVITFTETEETVETRISTETSGSELENEAAKIFKRDVAELLYRILNESEEEEENGKENNDNNGSMEISVRFLSR
jgi:hypothetical protein